MQSGLEASHTENLTTLIMSYSCVFVNWIELKLLLSYVALRSDVGCQSAVLSQGLYQLLTMLLLHQNDQSVNPRNTWNDII